MSQRCRDTSGTRLAEEARKALDEGRALEIPRAAAGPVDLEGDVEAEGTLCRSQRLQRLCWRLCDWPASHEEVLLDLEVQRLAHPPLPLEADRLDRTRACMVILHGMHGLLTVMLPLLLLRQCGVCIVSGCRLFAARLSLLRTATSKDGLLVPDGQQQTELAQLHWQRQRRQYAYRIRIVIPLVICGRV